MKKDITSLHVRFVLYTVVGPTLMSLPGITRSIC
jgi:hypothetical protein